MQCWSYHLLFELHMILCQMGITLFRRENGHLKGILIFVISFLVHLSRRLKCIIVIMRCLSSIRHLSSLTFQIFDFSSTTAEQNSMKLDRKQDLNVLYHVCVFPADRKKQDGGPGLWLAETFSTLPLKPLNWTQRNLTGSKISTSSTKFVFFGPIRKTRWPPWPLIGWDIFDFSSETIEPNSTKLNGKQDLNVLYRVCIFRADRANKMAALTSDWLRYFRLLLWNYWTEFNETWQEARSQRPLPCFYYSGRSVNKNGRPGLKKGGTLYSGARYVAL